MPPRAAALHAAALPSSSLAYRVLLPPAPTPTPTPRPQLCVWRLGAPTASMFFGLRLVFSVVLSTPILGSTIIQTGVQVCVCVCVGRLGWAAALRFGALWLQRLSGAALVAGCWAGRGEAACAGVRRMRMCAGLGMQCPLPALPRLQIAGVVVTAVAVTAYAGSQWWASRGEQLRQQLAERQAQGEAAAEAADLGASRVGSAAWDAKPPAPACCA